MPRKRKRPDYGQKNYTFHCRIIGDVPDEVWECAFTMHELWNRLCLAHDAMRRRAGLTAKPEAVRDALADAEEKAGRTLTRKEKQAVVWRLDKEARAQVPAETVRLAYQQFIDGRKESDNDPGIASKDTEAYRIAAAERGLASGCRWGVHGRFRNALNAWRTAKGLVGPPQARRLYIEEDAESPEHRLELIRERFQRIQIPYVCPTPGVSLDWLWRDSDRKHSYLNPARKPNGEPADRRSPYFPDSDVRAGYHGARAYFTVGGTRIPLDVTLHRDMPADAILKRIALCGENNPPFGWTWSLMLTVEEPPRAVLPATGRTAALDLGWRVREDSIRIGVLHDGERSYEILLPFDLSSRHQRRLRERIEARGGQVETALSWHDISELQAAQDARLELCKGELLRCDRSAWPQEAQQMMSGIMKMRAGGLNRLARMLERAGITLPALAEWQARHLQLARRIRAAQLHQTNRKDYLYRLIARWIAENFDILAWEDALGLKEMAMDASGEYAIEEAKKYRQYAGLYRLRQFIRETMNAPGRKLVDGGTAYSTRTCTVCGGQIEPSAKLWLTCENGHREDQDVNASRNLWQAIPEEMRAGAASAPPVRLSQLLPVIRQLKP